MTTKISNKYVKDIDVSKITFTDLISSKNNPSISRCYMNYDNGQFFIKMKNVSFPFGATQFSPESKTHRMDISLGSFSDEEIQIIRKIDDIIREFGKNNLKSILKNFKPGLKAATKDKDHQANLITYENMYNSFISTPKDKETGEVDTRYPPVWKASFKPKQDSPDEYDVVCINKHTKKCETLTKNNISQIFGKRSQGDVILKCNSIIRTTMFGASWKIVTIRYDDTISSVPSFSDDEAETSDIEETDSLTPDELDA